MASARRAAVWLALLALAGGCRGQSLLPSRTSRLFLSPSSVQVRCTGGAQPCGPGAARSPVGQGRRALTARAPLQCPQDDRLERRLCVFKDLAVINGEITYLYRGRHPLAAAGCSRPSRAPGLCISPRSCPVKLERGERGPTVTAGGRSAICWALGRLTRGGHLAGKAPSLKNISVAFTNWKFLPVPAQIALASLDDKGLAKSTAKRVVQRVAKAVVVDTTWPDNLYHAVAENLFEFHLKACLYLGECSGSNSTRLLMAPWHQNGPPTMNWTAEAPFTQDYLGCFTRQPALHYAHPSTRVGAGLEPRAAAPSTRALPLPHAACAAGPGPDPAEDRHRHRAPLPP